MKKTLLFLTFLFAFLPVFGQIAVGLSLNRSVYMQYEDIFACVSLRNDTGRVMIFGNDPKLQGFLLFEVLDSRDRRVAKISGQEISSTGLVLRPGEIKRLIIPVNRYYDLDRPDRYRIHCFVSHNQLPDEYRSKSVTFSVDEGIPIWKREVGVPDLTPDRSDKVVPARTYTIRMMREGQDRYYYLTVDDKDKIYGVARLGKIYGQEKYQAEVDMFSRLHLLIPMSPRLFHYLSFGTDGNLRADSYWKTTSSIPMLFRDSTTGIVTRIGGVQARPGVDFRDPKKGLFTADQLLRGEGIPNAGKRTPPKAPVDGGLVDLGKGVGE